MSLSLAPIAIKRAVPWNETVHRRRKKVQDHLWAISARRNGVLVGVAIVGRPARLLDDGRTLLVTRCAALEGDSSKSGHKGVCSMLYAACARAARAMGVVAFFTYTDLDEPGISLRAAGWILDGTTDGGEWDRPSRQRKLAICAEPKQRWRAPWSLTLDELAATRNVAPEQNQALGDTAPYPGKSNGSEGKSESLPGKSVEIDSLKRDNISLAADYEGAWNRAQNNARLLYAILRWIDCHPDDPVPPQALLLDAREAVRYAGVMLAWGEGGEEAQGIPEKAANPPVDSPRGVAGDRCEVGNECGRVGCPECQQ